MKLVEKMVTVLIFYDLKDQFITEKLK